MLVSSDVIVTKYLTQHLKKDRFILAHSLREHSPSHREGMTEGTQFITEGRHGVGYTVCHGREGMAEGTQSVMEAKTSLRLSRLKGR